MWILSYMQYESHPLSTRVGHWINALIVGNYLTTLGRDPAEDLDLLAELQMPVKELSKTL